MPVGLPSGARLVRGFAVILAAFVHARRWGATEKRCPLLLSSRTPKRRGGHQGGPRTYLHTQPPIGRVLAVASRSRRLRKDERSSKADEHADFDRRPGRYVEPRPDPLAGRLRGFLPCRDVQGGGPRESPGPTSESTGTTPSRVVSCRLRTMSPSSPSCSS